MKTHALFSYVTRVENGAITIRDLSNLLNCEGCVSVTNDAEAVVAEVVATHGNVRIFYFDTMGNRDELLHDNGVFKGFAPARTVEYSGT